MGPCHNEEEIDNKDSIPKGIHTTQIHVLDPEEIKTEISGIPDDVEVKELEKDKEEDFESGDSDVGKKCTEGKVKERRRRKQRVERILKGRRSISEKEEDPDWTAEGMDESFERDVENYRNDVCNAVNNGTTAKTEDIMDQDSAPKEDIMKQELDISGAKIEETNVVNESEESGDQQEKNYACNICGKRFLRQTSIKPHQAVHSKEKPFPCEICGQEFARKNYLDTHIKRVHLRERPHECTVCGMKFSQAARLKRHQVSRHSFERPFKCTQCYKAFPHKEYLQTHMKINHSETRKMYSCSICGKGFLCRKSRSSHMWHHTGVKPHRCDICGVYIVEKKRFNHHMERFHAGDKEHHIYNICEPCISNTPLKDPISGDNLLSCSYCMTDFRNPRTLKGHLGKHMGKAPFVCSLCQTAYP